jgi:hypothetical protein
LNSGRTPLEAGGEAFLLVLSLEQALLDVSSRVAQRR